MAVSTRRLLTYWRGNGLNRRDDSGVTAEAAVAPRSVDGLNRRDDSGVTAEAAVAPRSLDPS